MKKLFFISLFAFSLNNLVYGQKLYVPEGSVETVLGTGRIGLGWPLPNAGFHINSENDDFLWFDHGSSPRFFVSKRGATSMGTASGVAGNLDDMLRIINPTGPSTSARIEASASNAYWIANGKNHGSGLIMENEGDAKAFIYWSKSNGQGLIFDETSANGEEMIIKDGNVGIGTRDLEHKLNVDGTIKARAVICTTNWADFVFENDYKLRPLEEVERYIKENNRLPEIPAATEVQKNGISLGEANTLLLQKVEELTLYLIQINKENKVLQSEMDVLKSKLLHTLQQK